MVSRREKIDVRQIILPSPVKGTSPSSGDSSANSTAKRMKRKYFTWEKIAAIILSCIAILYFLSSTRLRMGKISSPGAGFFPLLIGILLTLCTGIYLIQTFMAKDRRNPPEKEAEGGHPWLGTTLALAGTILAYPVVLLNLNFLLGSFIIVFVILRILKYKSLLFSFLLGVVVSLSSFLLFAKLLGVALPNGILEQFILSL